MLSLRLEKISSERRKNVNEKKFVLFRINFRREFILEKEKSFIKRQPQRVLKVLLKDVGFRKGLNY